MREFLQRWIAKLGLETRPRLRKTIIAIIGVTIFLLGLTLIVLPGPAIVVIPLGLAILATEFAWARRVLRRGQLLVTKVRRNARNQRSATRVR
jgi:uncharacterized protein (TIGR02611 family)